MSEPPLWIFGISSGRTCTGASTGDGKWCSSSRSGFRRRRFHRQKLHLVLSGGCATRRPSWASGAIHLRAGTYREALERLGRPAVVHEPTSFEAADLVERLCADGLVADVLPTPTFALPRADFDAWAGDRTTFRMEDFYRAPRRRFDVLMDAGEPVGGRWNHDAENREPPPRGRATLDVPGPWLPDEDDIDARVRADLDAMDTHTVGRDGPRLFAVTADEAQRGRTSSSGGCRTSGRPRTRSSPPTGRWRTRCCRCRSTSACCIRSTPCAPPRTPTAPAPCRWRAPGLHPPGAGLAGVRLAAVLAVREELPGTQRAGGPHPAARLVDRPRRRRRHGEVPEHGPRGRPRPRLDPPHPALVVLGNYALQRGYRPRSCRTGSGRRSSTASGMNRLKDLDAVLEQESAREDF